MATTDATLTLERVLHRYFTTTQSSFNFVWYLKEFSDPSFRVVYGSLGVGNPPFWELGGEDYTKVFQFCQAPHLESETGAFDIHAWVEDAHGAVYDYVHVSMCNSARLHRKQIDFKAGEIIHGCSKEELSKRGLHYKACPEDIHWIIESMIQKRYYELYKREIAAIRLLWKHRNEWTWRLSQRQSDTFKLEIHESNLPWTSTHETIPCQTLVIGGTGGNELITVECENGFLLNIFQTSPLLVQRLEGEVSRSGKMMDLFVDYIA